MAPSTVLSVGILGGTGSLGRGLATRLLAAGTTVSIGSREPERARTTASELHRLLGPGDLPVRAGSNAEAATAEVVVLAVPFDALVPTLTPLAEVLRGRVVVSAVNPIAFDSTGPHAVGVAEGSAAQLAASVLPGAHVTAALHSLSGVALANHEVPMDDDVPVVGDDEDAVRSVLEVIDRIPGCRGVAAGPLRGAAALESLVPLLIEVNRRHRRHVGIRFSRL